MDNRGQALSSGLYLAHCQAENPVDADALFVKFPARLAGLECESGRPLIEIYWRVGVFFALEARQRSSSIIEPMTIERSMPM